MKKSLWFVSLLLLVCILTLSACDGGKSKTDFVDKKIIFKTLTVDGKNVSGEVANEITSFSFLDEIETRGKAEYSVSLDIHGMDVVPTKTVSLHFGDNTFYILATVDNHSKVYTVTIRRRPVYTVVFDTNGGTVIKSQTIEEGCYATTPQNPVKEGYAFINWDYEFKNPIMDNIVVRSQWDANTYKITYDANGGSVNSSTQTVSYDSSYTLEIPTRTGYTFAGWYDGEIRYYGGTWKTLNNVTLKAKWTVGAYNISYVNNGGTHSNPTTYTSEDEIDLTAPTKTGHTFLGWTYDGQTSPVLNVKISKGSVGNKKYTANWSVNSYKITYDANGGSVNSSTQTVSYDSSYTLEIPTRTGYTFAGWYDGEIRYYGGTWKTLNNVTLKAKWTINNYQVSIIGASGGSVSGSGRYEYNSTVTVSSKSNLGYTWLGWYDGNDNILSTKQSYSFTIGNNITLNAKWKISDDMSDFQFTSTETTCTITDVVDDSKTAYIIPTYVTAIDDWAFFMCDYLGNVTIPNGVISIGDLSFSGCKNLVSVVIPDSVTSLGEKAFSGCTKLTSITFNGKISKWNTIPLGKNWNFMIPATKVVCSDGTVTLS